MPPKSKKRKADKSKESSKEQKKQKIETADAVMTPKKNIYYAVLLTEDQKLLDSLVYDTNRILKQTREYFDKGLQLFKNFTKNQPGALHTDLTYVLNEKSKLSGSRCIVVALSMDTPGLKEISPKEAQALTLENIENVFSSGMLSLAYANVSRFSTEQEIRSIAGTVLFILRSIAPLRLPHDTFKLINLFSDPGFKTAPIDRITPALSEVFTKLKHEFKCVFQDPNFHRNFIADYISFLITVEQLEKMIFERLHTLPLEMQQSLKNNIKILPVPLDEMKKLLPPEEKKDSVDELKEMVFHNPTLTYVKNAELITEDVDIDTFPKVRNINLTKEDCLVIGDLHANIMKIIYFLLRENVLTGISEKEYSDLVTLYKKRLLLAKNDREQFIMLAKKLKPTNKNNSPRIIFIGDMLCDRVGHDVAMLEFLDHLKQHLSYTILLSNHDFEFIRLYETGHLFKPDAAPWRNLYSLQSLRLDEDVGNSANSIRQLGYCLVHQFITPERLKQLIETSYLPFLRPFEVQLNPQKKELYFLTHAPVPICILRGIADQLGIKLDINFESETDIAKKAAVLIDHIQQFIKNKKLHTLVQFDTSVYNLMWNRMEDAEFFIADLIPRGWNVVYIHGHDRHGNTFPISSRKREINLDNLLGKAEQLSKGKYTIFYTGNIPSYQLQLNPSENKESASPLVSHSLHQTQQQAEPISNKTPSASKSGKKR